MAEEKRKNPECFKKYVFAGSKKCRTCFAHVSCKAGSKETVNKVKK
jgi:hypothetical protein